MQSPTLSHVVVAHLTDAGKQSVIDGSASAIFEVCESLGINPTKEVVQGVADLLT